MRIASGNQSISLPVRNPRAKVGLAGLAARRAASLAVSAWVGGVANRSADVRDHVSRVREAVAEQLVRSTQPEGSAQAICSMASWDVGCWHEATDRAFDLRRAFSGRSGHAR